MAPTSTNDVREMFLRYFEQNAHTRLPSSSLVPHNDPTLMFANAGMNQFKNIFTGVEKTDLKRAATSQKCVRAGGKHNDLDNVGYTARHHTFFEMLGNFSFGDYFKEGAIRSAWELLTSKDYYGIDPNRLTFTVYHTDDEAFGLWKKITGCDDRRILRVPTKDNFWAMGDTGPCGPCSEIFYDHGEKAGEGEWALNPDGSDRFGSRFVEIWNLVFMQFDQVDANTQVPLPKPSIDTGMGLERITAVLQGVHDNYDIDLFRALIANIKENAAALGGAPAKEGAPYKVIADHLRSCGFLIADGVMPSNEGRGYVLRRIMRRAMRYAHQLGCKDPLMFRLVPALVREMGKAYPELARAEATITETLKQEEERFKQTLERGLKLLDEESANLSQGGTLPGDVAFKLYDTFGFPLDLTQDILRARGIAVDTDGFERSMEGQREMARAAWTGSGEKAVGRLWFDLKEKTGATQFTGYDEDASDAKIVAISVNGESVNEAAAGADAFLVLDRTPFYGESGGQIGDAGTFTANGKAVAEVLDTAKPVEDFHVHKTRLLAPLKVGDALRAEINVKRRDAIRANHSATHLLHKALRETLGDHVTQKGSLVAPDRLRFDFSHNAGVTREEMESVEDRVNAMIWHNTPVACRVMKPDEAIEAGAMALFGEKYGDEVRVLSMGDDNGKAYSVELCGGTHVRATGDIGQFKIVSEGSVASGIRRIEAVTGEGVRGYFIEEVEKISQQLKKLEADNAALAQELAALSLHAKSQLPLVVSADALKKADAKDLATAFARIGDEARERIQLLTEENKKFTKQLAEAKKQAALSGGGDVTKEEIGGVGFIARVFEDLNPKDLRGVAEDTLKTAEPGVAVVASGFEGKASVVVAVSKAITDKVSAVTLVQAAVEAVGGKGGGGRPEMAQGGGPDATKLQDAVSAIRAKLAA